MGTKIRQIEIYPSPIPLKEPFITSLGPVNFAENVLIIIRTENGLTGTGECSPFLPINGESMETAVVVARYLARALVGQDALAIDHCMQLMDRVIYGNTSIKSAFDIALYDLAARHENLPLYRFLGGEKPKTIQTDYTVSLKDAVSMAEDAQKIQRNGFQILKVKLGNEGKKDVERIQKIREVIGPDMPIRIDANQGWTTEEAIHTLKALAPYGIQHCEEPIPRWNYMELPLVRRESPIPIMADESCFDHHDAARLIRLNACDSMNIKLGKSSGIYKALKIIRLAEVANLRLQIGGFLESRIGFSASAHLALTSKQIQYFDFDTPLMFTEDPVEGGIEYKESGLIEIPELPGTGATIRTSYLKKLNKEIWKG
jgi:L-alanine-DL-glutamate epimerase-like enolase superfamily enzyme